MKKDNIKNNIIASLVLGLAITTSGWVFSHDNVNTLKEVVIEKQDDNKKLSIEIANLEDVIVQKEDDLKSKNMVIENKNSQINEQNLLITEQKRKLTLLRGEIARLKKENKRSYPTSNTVSRGQSKDVLYSLTVNASAYTAFCEGCSGVTATGYDVSNTIYYKGMRIVAVDPSVIPLYSIIKIEGFNEKFIALDKGGAIKNLKIDILVKSESDAVKFGRKNLKIKILK